MTVLTRASGPSTVARERRRLPQVIDLGVHSGPSARGSSYYKALLACPREFALAYEARITPAADSEALVVGTLVHLCLERYYKQLRKEQLAANGQIPYVSKRGMALAYEVLEPLETEANYEETTEVVRRILDGYFEEYADEKLRVLAAEETLMYRSANFEFSARLDLCVVDDRTGGFYLLENKTARSISEDLLGNYEMDLQILGQAWLVQRVIDLTKYPPFKGVMINIATKHTVPRFQRFPVNPSLAHLAMFERAIFDVRSQKLWAQSRGWPMSLGHCSGYARGYSRCQFYNLCHDYPDVGVADWKNQELPDGYVYKEETDDALFQERA